MLNTTTPILTIQTTVCPIGSVTSTSWVSYLDFWLLCDCGGTPWQPYYQRALAVRTVKQVMVPSYYFSVVMMQADISRK